ncbi:hypothetical protein M427DRAFT_506464 [Gonapodya prolifera JEL478]|uniref:BTB domain-containing protein n=1 Tax=Gonapodya prolifera (strain JEL478) TaxID=1344416 RepID=A0A139ASH6_GONPJ|nr:hypothetical protein M427DRAFT_506464 [Gonapodya prolifera JEL478]|eukprot:KXS19503.1 hypothetical protein M427DRAFT_506464 [Gonapodya prolifera JEL478]
MTLATLGALMVFVEGSELWSHVVSRGDGTRADLLTPTRQDGGETLTRHKVTEMRILIYNFVFEMDVGEGSPPPNTYSKHFKIGKHIFALMLHGDPRGVYLVPRTVTDNVCLKYRIRILPSPKEEPLFTYNIQRTFLKDKRDDWGQCLGDDWNTIESKLQGREQRFHIGLQIYDHPELRELVASHGAQRVLSLPVILPGLTSFVTVPKKDEMPFSLWSPPTLAKVRWHLRAAQTGDFKQALEQISSLSAATVVLAANNDYFAGLFTNQCEETTSGKLDAKEYNAAVLKDLLSFVYTGVLARCWDSHQLQKLKQQNASTLCSNTSLNISKVMAHDSWRESFLPFAAQSEVKDITSVLWTKLGELVDKKT